MEPSHVALIAGLVSLAPTVFLALLTRAVRGIDTAINSLSVKQERLEAKLEEKFAALTTEDTAILVELSELRVRVLTLESEFSRWRPR